MVLKFDEDLKLNQLPLEVNRNLILELDKDNSWKILAEYISEKLDCPSHWITSLKNERSLDDTPARKLLTELEIKMCTVGILSTVLEACKLMRPMSILHFQEPLKIVRHPDQDLNSSTFPIVVGDQLQLICTAIGLPPPNYQWYHENTALEGKISKELNLTVESTNQKGCYRCKVYQEDQRGVRIHELFSKPVFVNIKLRPVSIEKQPQIFSEVKEGESLILSCEADGYPEPQFQWYRNNEKLIDEISKILRIKTFTAKHEGKYYCHIFNGISEKYSDKSTVLLELPCQKAVAKVALLIANENYDNQQMLRTPKNDVAKVAKILTGLGFHTICLADLTLSQMDNAIRIFCESLTKGAYGLFYFTGHGFKMQENYMLPIDAPLDYLRKNAICESMLLSLALKSDPALFVQILDMCQTIPPVECNPEIHEEIPLINQFQGRRNLLQAYSTSSNRPSYERKGKEYGLYATHLCKYLGENIPITKVFEQIGKSIDASLKGAERKQIPMFATTITKPFRLTDAMAQTNLPTSVVTLEKFIEFPCKVADVNFQQSGIICKATISQHVEPFLNLIQISFSELDEKWEINFYNSVHCKRNNLFQCSSKNKCWLRSPETNEGPIVVTLLENGTPVGAKLLDISKYLPLLLMKLNQ